VYGIRHRARCGSLLLERLREPHRRLEPERRLEPIQHGAVLPDERVAGEPRHLDALLTVRAEVADEVRWSGDPESGRTVDGHGNDPSTDLVDELHDPGPIQLASDPLREEADPVPQRGQIVPGAVDEGDDVAVLGGVRVVGSAECPDDERHVGHAVDAVSEAEARAERRGRHRGDRRDGHDPEPGQDPRQRERGRRHEQGERGGERDGTSPPPAGPPLTLGSGNEPPLELPAEVRRVGERDLDREGAQCLVERNRPPVVHSSHPDARPPSAAARRARARVSRDFTVPGRTPASAAVSASDRSRK
jgi:hypothetical protein